MTQEELNRLSALEAERKRLVDEIQSVDAQLSEKRKYDRDGRMWTAPEYHEWRAKAVAVRFSRLKRLRSVKEELESLRQKRHTATVKAAAGVPLASGADALLAAAHDLLRRLVSDGVDLDPDEFAVLDAIRDHLSKAAQKEGA